MKNIYSKYWTYARERKYGFLEYDKNLCNYITKNVSKKKNILVPRKRRLAKLRPQ